MSVPPAKKTSSKNLSGKSKKPVVASASSDQGKGRVGGWLIWQYLRFVRATSQTVYEPEDAPDRLSALHPSIIAVWHGQFLMVPFLRPEGKKANVIVARHGDAALIGKVMEKSGCGILSGAGAGVKGRDKGGAAALKGALDALKRDESVVLTADIPPGPARIAGDGIMTMARLSGKPIVPVAVATSHYKALNSWSRFTINLPFSRQAVIVGEPVHVPRKCTPGEVEELRLQVEARLTEATRRAYELAGTSDRQALPLAYRPPVKGTPRKLWVYSQLSRVLQPVLPLYLKRRAQKGKEEKDLLPQRYGHADRARPEGALIWFHAASVGETNAVLPLMGEIRKRYPHLHILLTTMTVTSANIAKSRLPEGVFHQYIPLDTPRYMQRFLDHWQPDMLLFVESELWPNLIQLAAERAVPLYVVNGRMSKRTFRRWRKSEAAAQKIFGSFKRILAQNKELALWYHRLGGRAIEVTGSLKLDSPPLPVNKNELEGFQKITRGRHVWIASSTHAGEEEQVAKAHLEAGKGVENLLTILVPRHPHRGDEIEAMLKAQGLVTARRSKDEPLETTTDIYIADTIGELGLFYRLGEIAFIGGSLVPHGGQNPVEAAQLSAAVLTGPHWHNFTDQYQKLLARKGAVEVHDAQELSGLLVALFKDEEQRAKMIQNATEVVEEMGGALEKTLKWLEEDLELLSDKHE